MKRAFTILEDRVLGEGVLGTLYEGVDNSSRRPLTITVLRSEFSVDPLFSRRFHREIARASRTVHPNVVQTYGSGLWKGKLFYATEQIDGKGLRCPVRGEDRIAPDEILRIAEGSARALIAAEKHRITPLHLRKDGIFIARDGTVKVSEIGLSRILGKDADYQRVFPSSPYLSPERSQGRKVDVRSDIFALGVILYELATGRPPFEGHESKTSYVYQLLNVAPVPPRQPKPTVSRELNGSSSGAWRRIPNNAIKAPPESSKNSARSAERSGAATRRMTWARMIPAISKSTRIISSAKAAWEPCFGAGRSPWIG